MAFLKIPNVAIKGISACVPPGVEENRDIPFYSSEEAEKVIESTFYAAQFVGVFFGEWGFEIPSHHPFAVAHDVVDEHEEYVGNGVEHSERQEGERIKQSVYYGVNDAHNCLQS